MSNELGRSRASEVIFYFYVGRAKWNENINTVKNNKLGSIFLF